MLSLGWRSGEGKLEDDERKRNRREGSDHIDDRKKPLAPK